MKAESIDSFKKFRKEEWASMPTRENLEKEINSSRESLHVEHEDFKIFLHHVYDRYENLVIFLKNITTKDLSTKSLISLLVEKLNNIPVLVHEFMAFFNVKSIGQTATDHLYSTRGSEDMNKIFIGYVKIFYDKATKTDFALRDLLISLPSIEESLQNMIAKFREKSVPYSWPLDKEDVKLNLIKDELVNYLNFMRDTIIPAVRKDMLARINDNINNDLPYCVQLSKRMNPIE